MMEQDYPAIRWNNLTLAMDQYQSEFKFKYVEVPWIVPQDITEITFSGPENHFTIPSGDLVGSAEQSFIYLRERYGLEDGCYCAITPCFRNEPVVNNMSRLHFMKVELIAIKQGIDAYTEENVSQMAEMALQTMENLCRYDDVLKIVKVDDEQFDIELNGIEVGSYGLRHCNGYSWIYGTGLAEPRFSQAMETLNAV